MVEKSKKELSSTQSTFAAQNGQALVVPLASEKKKYAVCDVCGHANPEEAAMCEMCSNYLK
jgi:recombinational DNA repair protein RecR